MITIKKVEDRWAVFILMGTHVLEKWNFKTFGEARQYARTLAEIERLEIILNL